MTINLPLYLGAIGFGGIKKLSPSSVALAILAVGRADKRRFWTNAGNSLTDTEWDELDAQISLCLDELMSDMIGMMFPYPSVVAPNENCLLCDGSIFNRDDYLLLYDSLDPVYRVSGTQFQLPDLRDRFIVGSSGSYSIDAKGGENSHTLSIDEIPPHTHNYNYPSVGVDIESAGVPDVSAVGNPPVSLSTSSAGAGNAHENRPPYIALAWFIVAR